MKTSTRSRLSKKDAIITNVRAYFYTFCFFAALILSFVFVQTQWKIQGSLEENKALEMF